MKDLYILGAGDLAKELVDSIQAGSLVSTDCKFKLKACLDIKKGESIRGIPCLLESDILSLNLDNVVFILGTAHPIIKKKLISRFTEVGGVFPNFVHQTSLVVATQLKPFSGNILCAYSYISSDVKIGSYNFFNWHVTIGHDCELGKGNSFNPGSRISGKVKLGDYNFIGANGVILEGRKIGNSNTIGASAMLRSNIDNDETWVGVPARKIER